MPKIIIYQLNFTIGQSTNNEIPKVLTIILNDLCKRLEEGFTLIEDKNRK